MPMPVSPTVSSTVLPSKGGDGLAHHDLAGEGVFERIGDQIEHDLFPHVPIYIDRFGTELRRSATSALRRDPWPNLSAREFGW